MLAHPVRHEAPFVYFTVRDALGAGVCERLAAEFDVTDAWERHDTFYQCWMRDITGAIGPDLRGVLIGRMAQVTGLPLIDGLKVTAQRMLPGDQALPHSDRPLLGFEAVRLVLQLTPDWRPEHGGWFRVFADPDGLQTVREHAPRFDTAVGFAMLPGSHHAVTPVTAERRTVVFNFWHAGNTPALRDHLRDLFGAMRFGDLPSALDPLISEAEQTHDDEATLRAATAAYALMRWGLPEVVQAQGYTATLRGWDPEVPGPHGAAVALARWATRLWHDDFDLQAWATLRDRLQASIPEAEATRALAFP